MDNAIQAVLGRAARFSSIPLKPDNQVTLKITMLLEMIVWSVMNNDKMLEEDILNLATACVVWLDTKQKESAPVVDQGHN